MKNFSASQYLSKLALPALAALVSFANVACDAATVKHQNLKTAPKPKKEEIAGKQSGLMLDTARHFYPVPVIKDFIDTIAASGGNFLHLHFSDNENYALESKILNQLAKNATQNAEGVYINPNTGKPFLSYRQLDEIKRYAKSKNIELIPEVDSPGHMAAIFQLLEHHRGKNYVQSLKLKDSEDEEIDITNPKSVALVKSLITEVADAFSGSGKHFHIGGDEFSYSADSNHQFIAYANSLAAFLSEKKLKTRMWNDGLIKPTLDQLDRNIQITYWSYDGDPENKTTAVQRRKIRSSMPELVEKGFGVMNYNSYYLYVVPKQNWGTSHNSDFAARDVLKRWNLGVWDGENHRNAIKDTSKILGASLAIWGENAGSLNSSTIQKYTAGLLESVIWKTRGNEPVTVTGQKRNAITHNAPLLEQAYLDLEQIKNETIVDLKVNNKQTLHLLQEASLNKRKGLNVWVKGSPQSNVVLGSQWQKTGKTTQKNGVDYHAYQYQDAKLWLDKNLSIVDSQSKAKRNVN